jgi:hypothetical protein
MPNQKRQFKLPRLIFRYPRPDGWMRRERLMGNEHPEVIAQLLYIAGYRCTAPKKAPWFSVFAPLLEDMDMGPKRFNWQILYLWLLGYRIERLPQPDVSREIQARPWTDADRKFTPARFMRRKNDGNPYQ